MKQISKDILELARATNAAWCILRKEDEILQGVHNDIDLFVAPRAYRAFIATLRNGFADTSISILRERQMPAGVSFLLYSQSTGEFEKLDVLFENTLLFFTIFSSKEIAENIVPGAAYPVLSSEAAQELSFRKETARRDPLAFLRHIWQTRRKGVRGPRTAIRGSVAAYLANRRNRPGAFVVLVGPDGSGKTTVAESLAVRAKADFFSVSLHHFSIQTFPRLATLLLRRSSGPDYTIAGSGTRAPIQSARRAWIYMIYYGAELMVYSHFRLKRRLRLGQLVIFDRYFHDWFFQRSYRRASRPTIRAFLARAVRPDLVVYLTGDPARINARKPELSAEEIGVQQDLIESDLMPFWQGLSVPTLTLDTTDVPLEQVVQTVRSKLTPI